MNSYDKETWGVKESPLEKVLNNQKTFTGNPEKEAWQQPSGEEFDKPKEVIIRDAQQNKRRVRRSNNPYAKPDILGKIIAIILVIISIVFSIWDPFPMLDDDYSDSPYTTYSIEEDMLDLLEEDVEAAADNFAYEDVEIEGYVSGVDKDKREFTLVPNENWDRPTSVKCKIAKRVELGEEGEDDNDEYVTLADIPYGSKVELEGVVTEVDGEEGYSVDVDRIISIN